MSSYSVVLLLTSARAWQRRRWQRRPVAWFVKRVTAGGREMLRVEVGKRARMPKQALALFGLRLELVAEVRRAVGRGSAHPKKEVERRRKVLSGVL
jgi:hypothetical protein